MGQREDMVEELVIDVINNCFCNGLFDKGRIILHKAFLQHYNYLDNMHTRRNLLYRLIVSERNSKEDYEKALEMHVRQLKKDMDNTLNYKEQNTSEYLDMMSYYTDCKYIHLSDEEKLNYYDLSYNFWKGRYKKTNNVKYYMWMKVAKFNKALFQKKFKIILEMVKDLHNTNDETTDSTIKQMLKDIEKLDKNLYDKAYKIVYINNNLMNCI
jgi:hypothetical protein